MAVFVRRPLSVRLQKAEQRIGKHVVAVTGYHVSGSGDVDSSGVRDEVAKFAHAIRADDIASGTTYQ